MAKAKEKALLAEIEWRTGRNVFRDGERTRPYYLNNLINLQKDEENVALVQSIKV